MTAQEKVGKANEHSVVHIPERHAFTDQLLPFTSVCLSEVPF